MEMNDVRRRRLPVHPRELHAADRGRVADEDHGRDYPGAADWNGADAGGRYRRGQREPEEHARDDRAERAAHRARSSRDSGFELSAAEADTRADKKGDGESLWRSKRHF